MTGSLFHSDPYLLMTDGGSRGNPGPAAAGIVLKNPAGKMVHSAGLFIGRATNNVAEYSAVIAGLKAAARLGVKSLRIQSDSELLVRQLNGQYRVKSEDLRPLYEQTLQLLRQFEQAEVRHVMREKNAEADSLVNRALDSRRDILPGAGGNEAAAGNSTWPPDTFTAQCLSDGFEGCPGVVSAGGLWEFKGVTPGGLCLHAAAAILQAVNSSKAGTKVLEARCGRSGCKASFRIRF